MRKLSIFEKFFETLRTDPTGIPVPDVGIELDDIFFVVDTSARIRTFESFIAKPFESFA